MDNQQDSSPSRPRSGSFWSGALSGAAIAVVAGVAIFSIVGHSNKIAAPPTRTIAAAQPLEADATAAAAIEAEAKQLIGAPRTITLTIEKSHDIDKAITAGDYDTAQKIASDVYAQSHIRYGHFVPFNELMYELPARESDPNRLARLDGWVAKYPKSAFPYLVRSQYFLEIARDYRGEDYVNKVDPEDMEKFSDYLARADSDIRQAIALDESDPVAYYYNVQELARVGNSPELGEAFKASVARFPDYYSPYQIMLQSLEPKWGGSVAAMYAFTEASAGNASDTSPVKLLYVQLYADLLNTAWTACEGYDGEHRSKCIQSGMSQLVKPDLETKVHAALNLYSKNDPYLFSMQLEPILADMESIPGGDVYRGAIMQLAGDAMGSSNELVHDSGIKNNFVLDEVTAGVWYRQKQYENAYRKYNEALADTAWMKFPSEEEKDQAIAHIYIDLAHVYADDSQIAKSIAYAKAAEAVGGVSSDFACTGYYALKNYADAERECTARYEESGRLRALYYRARAFQATRDYDKALADYTMVADFPNYLRSYAVINGSVVFGDRGDMPGQEKFLNDHPFLFNEATQSEENLSIAYNNRCYSEKNLGELQKALDDCTISLKHGSLPDAYQKQQELVRMLKDKGKQ